jgi:methylmalonyl-CoA/ethylmalonyl-CoA epimerase
MILRIDHVSVAVREGHRARRFFETLMGAIAGAGAVDAAMKYRWNIFSLGDMSRLELLSPTGKGSFLDGFLKRREGGVHHITLQTADIQQTKQKLTEQGLPFFGFSDDDPHWKELFIHPRDAFGVLIQIAEFNADDFLNETVKFTGKKPWAVSPTKDGCQLSIAHPGGGKAAVALDREETRQLANELILSIKRENQAQCRVKGK